MSDKYTEIPIGEPSPEQLESYIMELLQKMAHQSYILWQNQGIVEKREQIQVEVAETITRIVELFHILPEKYSRCLDVLIQNSNLNILYILREIIPSQYDIKLGLEIARRERMLENFEKTLVLQGDYQKIMCDMLDNLGKMYGIFASRLNETNFAILIASLILLAFMITMYKHMHYVDALEFSQKVAANVLNNINILNIVLTEISNIYSGQEDTGVSNVNSEEA